MEVNLCPYCSDPIEPGEKEVFDDDDKQYWHYECAIQEREDFENKQAKK